MNRISVATAIIFFGASFLASLLGVALFTRWSLHRGFIDVPNERSSHSKPTPRGGGLLIVAIGLIGYLIIGFALGLAISWGYLAGALIVALVSWLDDLYSLPFWSRLIIHIVAAGILVWDVGFWSELFLPLISADIMLGKVFGFIFTILLVVWLLNAYNFMDGIDGIAAAQAVIGCVAWAVLAYAFDLPSTFLLCGIVASASAGFLIHNWQPATVFMGDVGSAFLGFTLAAMPLLVRSEARMEAPELPVIALLFIWFFVFDSIFTFSRRLLGGKRVWEAHREHIYQKLVIEGWQHSAVTILYALASAVLCLLVVLAIILSGIYAWLAFLSLLVLTFLIAYLGSRRKFDVNI